MSVIPEAHVMLDGRLDNSPLNFLNAPVHTIFAPDATVRGALEAALADHRALIRRHGEIHEALNDAADRSSEERLHAELDAVEHHLDHMGWDLEPRLKEAQTTWGLLDLEAAVVTEVVEGEEAGEDGAMPPGVLEPALEE